MGCFLILAQVQSLIDAGERPTIGYHLLAYVLLTAAEVMFVVTLIEFTCRKAKRLRSLAVAGFMLSVSAGNLLTAAVNTLMVRSDGTSRLEGSHYYLFFCGLIAVTAVGYGWLAYRKYGAEPVPAPVEVPVPA